MRGLVAWIGRTCLSLGGWRVVGGRPEAGRYVLIAAPHTSNWDFPLTVLYGMALGIWPAWVGKHTLFRFPLGLFFRALRGIPVVRGTPKNLVEQLAAQFSSRGQLVLLMPPEGTRSRAAYWKSGFYFVARRAGVPVAMGFLDYARREGGIGPLVHPGNDLHADMELLRTFYAGKLGRYPQLQGPIRLRVEDELPGVADIERPGSLSSAVRDRS
jgi:1-acyl-sn-glycerol-3-phosphate acyltransferase